jgi:chromosome partitioning protein
MILTVGNVKGGVGKTTLAINIAIARARAGFDVLLIDGDEQHTAASFTELRNTQAGRNDYTAVRLVGAAVRTQTRLLSSKYSDIVIDAGGRDTGSFRAALTITDILLVPVQPRTFDVWVIDHVAHLVAEAREINEQLRAVSVLNAADPVGQDNREAAEALTDIEGIEYLPHLIVRRKAFPNAAAQGLSVLEYVPRDQKAVQELKALLEHLYGNVTPP